MTVVFRVEKTMRSEIEKAWRDRLAHNLRNFRRIKGRWPDQQIMAAVKNSIGIAAKMGLRPPYLH